MTTQKTNGVGGLKWSTIAAFLALFIPILGQIGQVHVLGTRLEDHIKTAETTIAEIKSEAGRNDDRIRDHSGRITALESEPE